MPRPEFWIQWLGRTFHNTKPVSVMRRDEVVFVFVYTFPPKPLEYVRVSKLRKSAHRWGQ